MSDSPQNTTPTAGGQRNRRLAVASPKLKYTLCNCSRKILAKVLSRLLNEVILYVIHTYQSGFMPHRSTLSNIFKVYVHNSIVHKNIGERVFLSIDAVKALDSVELGFLWACMEHLGMGPNFCKWVQILYGALNMP